MWRGFYEFDVNQWGVGHGGFHSQSVRFRSFGPSSGLPVRETYLRVIYDCGAGRGLVPTSALKRAVGRMLAGLASDSRIDLLVVSHFDQDHVNGLEHLAAELTKRRISVARVWAPVLTKNEALFAIASSGLSGAALASYAALVYDPAGRLVELFSGAEITQFGPNDEPIPFPRSDTDTSDEGTGGDGEIVLTAEAGGRGMVAREVGPGREMLWEFRPYVIGSTLEGAKSVADRVQAIIGKKAEECSLADLIKLASHSALLEDFHVAFREVHTDRPPVGETSSARSGPNLSSLCLYSGPVSPYDWWPHVRWIETLAERPGLRSTPSPIAPAWLGTGDAGLLKAQHVGAMRTVLTQGRLDRVGIASAPHHGSRHDSGALLWDALPNVRVVTVEAKNDVGSSGNSHPHAEVLAELATRDLDVRACTVDRDFISIDLRFR